VGQIVRLVDDLLDHSRITRGVAELRREEVELASAVDGALETCARCSSRRATRWSSRFRGSRSGSTPIPCGSCRSSATC
jgi:signal transduction histidine kinase